MSELSDQNKIEDQVGAHIERLSDRVESAPNEVSIELHKIDPQFSEEDKIALEQVNNILSDVAFKKKLCAGLDRTSSDLGELSKVLVKILLPASAVVKGGTIVLLGQAWTFAALPIGIIGTSILAIYAARFGIGYFCGDQET